jgi:hypothetical protein
MGAIVNKAYPYPVGVYHDSKRGGTPPQWGSPLNLDNIQVKDLLGICAQLSRRE